MENAKVTEEFHEGSPEEGGWRGTGKKRTTGGERGLNPSLIFFQRRGEKSATDGRGTAQHEDREGKWNCNERRKPLPALPRMHNVGS